MNLHHDAEPRAKVVLEGVAIFFFVRTGPVTTGTDSMPFDYFRGVISEDSAKQDSLDESSAFLIEGAQYNNFSDSSGLNHPNSSWSIARLKKYWRKKKRPQLSCKKAEFLER